MVLSIYWHWRSVNIQFAETIYRHLRLNTPPTQTTFSARVPKFELGHHFARIPKAEEKKKLVCGPVMVWLSYFGESHLLSGRSPSRLAIVSNPVMQGQFGVEGKKDAVVWCCGVTNQGKQTEGRVSASLMVVMDRRRDNVKISRLDNQLVKKVIAQRATKWSLKIY